MQNKKKGVYVRIYQDPTGNRKDFVIEMGTEFDACKVSVDFADLASIKNEITAIQEKARQHEQERD